MRGGWFGVLAIAGCMAGGGPAGAPAPAPEVVAPAVAPAVAPVGAHVGAPVYDAVEVVCARAVRCGTIGRSQLGECRKGPGASRLVQVWGFDEMLGIPGLVAQGRLKVMPAADQECFAYLATAPCQIDPEHARKGCFGGVMAFRRLAPGVAPGGECTRWEECIDGFCTAQTACEGVCVAKSRIGEACGAWQVCEDGAFCEKDVCRARAAVGEECRGHWQWCQDGLMCDGYHPGIDDDHYMSPEQPGKCSAGKRLGEGCVPPKTASGDVCVHGLYCDWGFDAPVCRAPLAAGEACRWDDACGDGLECAGLVLGGSHPAGGMFAVRKAGRCTRPLDAGDACDPQAFVSGCPDSMVCDLKTSVCRSSGHLGDPCQSSWVTGPHPADVPLRTEGCVGDTYCDAATRTCKKQVLKGGKCTPQKFGVEDSPCFLGECDEKTRRCVVKCPK